MVVCAVLPPEKGASPREESRQRGYHGEGGGGERTKGGIAGRGVGTKRERRLTTLPCWKGNGRGGKVNFATWRDRRRKSSSPLSRLSFIDTRGFVFQSRDHETRRRVVRV